jgi:hypothetical protein
MFHWSLIPYEGHVKDVASGIGLIAKPAAKKSFFTRHGLLSISSLLRTVYSNYPVHV